MKIKKYTTIATTVFVGVIAGYGVIVSVQAMWYVARYVFVNPQTPEPIVEQSDIIAPEQQQVFPESPNIVRRALSFITQTGSYHVVRQDVAFPKISAKSFIVADMETGEVIMSRDSFVERPIASVSKLMTALVALQHIDQTAILPVSYKAVTTYGTQGGLRSGEKLPASAVMHAMMLQSSNDAAEVFAEFLGRDVFLQKMNEQAAYIGMKNTRFEDPSGLSEKNISSADDLSRLIQYIYKSYPELVDVIHTQSYSYGRHTWFSNSVFTSDTKYLGGKNGYTDEARYTLVSMFKLPLGVNSEMHNVAIILLGSEQSEKDARALMLYLLRNVEFY